MWLTRTRQHGDTPARGRHCGQPPHVGIAKHHTSCHGPAASEPRELLSTVPSPDETRLYAAARAQAPCVPRSCCPHAFCHHKPRQSQAQKAPFRHTRACAHARTAAHMHAPSPRWVGPHTSRALFGRLPTRPHKQPNASHAMPTALLWRACGGLVRAAGCCAPLHAR